VRQVKTILYFQRSFCDMNQRQVVGACAYARQHDWHVQVILYGNAPNPVKPDLRTLFAFWNPDGCIVDCGSDLDTFCAKDFGSVPTVFIDQYPSNLGSGAVCVTSDTEGIVSLVARELLMENLSGYAYVDWPCPQVWSAERGDAFDRLVALHGKRFFRHTLQPLEKSTCLKDLTKWIAGLPRPCGLFAANDLVAGYVMSAAVRAGLSVPQDLSVVGVDNDVVQCENSPVSLTSVSLDREGGGRVAAELLDRLMRGNRHVPCGLIRATGLVRRASTRLYKDFRVQKAIEYIRLNACEGIKVDDVVKTMSCSRTLAYRCFCGSVGHSILDEIHRVRIERAKHFLRERKHGVEAVSDFCGYASSVEFRRTFKRLVGKSPKQWRDLELGEKGDTA